VKKRSIMTLVAGGLLAATLPGMAAAQGSSTASTTAVPASDYVWDGRLASNPTSEYVWDGRLASPVTREYVWDDRLASSLTDDYVWDGRLASSPSLDLALTE